MVTIRPRSGDNTLPTHWQSAPMLKNRPAGVVVTGWRHQTLSTSFLPSQFQSSPLALARLADGAGACKAGPLHAVPALASAVGGAKGLPARAACRPAEDGQRHAVTVDAASLLVTKRRPKSPAEGPARPGYRRCACGDVHERIEAQAELLNHDGLIGFRKANDWPEPAALLRQADAVLCAMLAAGSAHFYADGKPYRVRFD